MNKITVIFHDGKTVTQENVKYILYTGVKLVIALDSGEQFALLFRDIATLDIE